MTAPGFIRSGQAYRPDIDLLRAIAVAAVVLYHAGLTALPGGFAGVDVFFVISGYLISKHLVEEAERTGRVDIAGFYQRRVRRIAPALICTCFVTTAVATVLLFPVALQDYGASLLATVVFVSNIVFWRSAGYFAAQDETVPLLHTWSLAVEEQFYIFIPVAIALLARRGLRPVVLAGFAVSLGLSIGLTDRYPGAAFYLLPTRAWELLLGTIIALRLPPIERAAAAVPGNVLAAAGLAAIGASMVVLDEAMPFPGSAALLPCLGAALVIIAGRDGVPRLSAALAVRPALHLGMVSYSLYLWHWPVIVFWTYAGMGPAWAAAVLSYVLAVASWRYVETPWRSGAVSVPRLLLASAAGAALLVALGAALLVSGGFPGRFSERVVAFDAATRERAASPSRCDPRECGLGIPGRPSVILIGDSHAFSLAPAIDAALTKAGIAGGLSHQNACPPFYGSGGTGSSTLDREACGLRNGQGMLEMARDDAVRDVFLTAAKRGGECLSCWRTTIELFRRHGKRVSVIYGLPVPEWGRQVPLALAKAEAFGMPRPVLVRRSESLRGLAREYAGAPDVRFIDLGPALCSGNTCPPEIGGHPVYIDAGHLNRHVAETAVAGYLIDQLQP